MTTVSFLISLSLLGQVRAADGPLAPAPRFTPRTSAPPARIDDERSRATSGTRPRATYVEEDEPVDDKIRTFGSKSRTTAADDERMAPVGGVNQKMRPPEIMAEALAEVPEGAFLPVEGEASQYQSVRLVDAMKRVNDRTRQIQIAQIYWKLAIAQADYHFARDAVAQLRDATRGQLNQPALRAARCAMRALQRDAEALVIRAQNSLAAEMGLPANAQMPLAVDIPHTGSYDTRFSQVYSGRVAPARAYLIDRTLPVRRQSIEEHAEGILAALDAVDASADEYAKGTADLTTLILAFERLWKERKAFTAAVRDYNQDIAEYALTVAPTTSDASALVAMLIKSNAGTTRSPSTGTSVPGTTTPRSTPRYSEPVDDEAPTLPRTGTGSERYKSIPADEEDPTPTPRFRTDSTSDPFRRGTSTPTPADNVIAAARWVLGEGMGAVLHTANYQLGTKRNIDFDDEDAQRALWRALVDVDTPLRTQRLAGALNAPEMLPRDAGRQVSLGECLAMCPPNARREVISAYWYAREAVAAYQVLMDESTELAGLTQAATRIRSSRGGPEAAIRLQAMRRIVKASLRDAEVELLHCQYDLTSRCGARLEDDWLLPSTSPHGGRYLLRIDEQPPEIVIARKLDQLGSLVKVLHEQMEDHAGTVVYADSARATALRDPGVAPKVLDIAMALVERQATHTVFFLRATTKYNLAIANYVLAIMPENVSAEKLVSALVLTRNKDSRT